MPSRHSTRRFRTALLAGLLLSVLSMPLPGADGPPESATVTQLIRQLDARSRMDRQAAEEALLKLGPAVLDELPPPDLLPGVAVREAVNRIRTQLEREAARQSIAAARVTLQGDVTIQTAVGAIAEQTGNRVECSDQPEEKPASTRPDANAAQVGDACQRKVTVDWQSTPFWETVRELEAAGFRAAWSGERNALELVPLEKPTAAGPLPTQIQQAFRLEALPAERRPIPGTPNSLVRVPLRIVCEPRLRPLFLRCSMSDLSLAGDNQTLEPFSPESRIEIPLGDGGRTARVELTFLAPSSATAPDNLRLTGRLDLLTAALEREITFPTLSTAKGLTRRRGGVTVTVSDTHLSPADADRHAARVSVQIGYDSGARAFESHQTWVFHNRVFLRDAQGREYAANDGFSTLFQGDGTVGVEYRFSDLPEHPADWQFTYVAPTLLINVPLTVDIAGIRTAASP